MIKADTKGDIDQTVEEDTVDCHLEVDFGTDKFIKNGLSVAKITEKILGEEIVEEHTIINVKILEEDTDGASGTVILIKVGVGLERDNF